MAEYSCPRRLRASMLTTSCSVVPSVRSNPKLTKLWQMSLGPQKLKKRSTVRSRDMS